MNIVFMGTPEFAVPTLQALIASEHSVVAVVTAPDKPRGRGREVSGTPVKDLAFSSAIPVLQPESLRDEHFHSTLRSCNPDLFMVVAFRILPPEVFTIPPQGTINLHASLLPRYRGAAPINWALINGEKETGVTTFFIQEKVDTGNIILQRTVPVPPDMTAGELHDILAAVGSEAVLETVRMVAQDSVRPQKQDDALATPAPKIFREQCSIDWSGPADSVHNFIRGLSPRPCAWAMHGKVQLKILRSRVEHPSTPEPPGSVIRRGERLFVGCGRGLIEILELQQEGRKAMEAQAFLRGYHLEDGAALG